MRLDSGQNTYDIRCFSAQFFFFFKFRSSEQAEKGEAPGANKHRAERFFSLFTLGVKMCFDRSDHTLMTLNAGVNGM